MSDSYFESLGRHRKRSPSGEQEGWPSDMVHNPSKSTVQQDINTDRSSSTTSSNSMSASSSRYNSKVDKT